MRWACGALPRRPDFPQQPQQVEYNTPRRSEGGDVQSRRVVSVLVLAGVAVLGATAAFAAGDGQSAAAARRGGSITIARIEDSQSFDKTNVFQNESIWITQQIMEPLYTAGKDGKTLKPWLATGYK